MCCWIAETYALPAWALAMGMNNSHRLKAAHAPSAETWYHKNFMLSTSIIKSCCRHSRASCHAREPNVLLDCWNVHSGSMGTQTSHTSWKCRFQWGKSSMCKRGSKVVKRANVWALSEWLEHEILEIWDFGKLPGSHFSKTRKKWCLRKSGFARIQNLTFSHP